MDAAAARRFMVAAGPLARLERARAYLQLGDFMATRRELDAALEQGGSLSLIRTIAGVMLFRTGDYHEALELLRGSIGDAGPSALYVLDIARKRAGRIGWHHEELELLNQGLTRRHRLPWIVRAAELHETAENFTSAAEYYERAVATQPDDPRWGVRLGRCYARLGRAREASTACARVLPHPAVTAALALAAARALIFAGDFPGARRALARAHELGAAAVSLAERARLAAWEGDAARARDLANQSRDLEDSASALRTLGVCAALEGELELAARRLDEALARDPDDPEALTWRAELLMRAGQFEEAVRLNERGAVRAEGYPLTYWMLQLRITLGRGDPQPILSPNRFDELRDGLLEIYPEAAALLATGRHDDAIAALDEALRRLRGNRSEYATFLRDGALVRVKTLDAPRQASRDTQLWVRSAPPDYVLRGYDRVLQRHGHSPLVLAHRGELKLWLGDIDGAARDLEAAIELEPETRWPYIGLILVETLRGAPERGLEIGRRGVEAMHGTTGPALFGYRGEALRLLGRLDEAITDFEEALHARPRRIPSTINLALARHARGDADALRGPFNELVQRVPGLMSDAARERGHRLFAPSPDALDERALSEILEHALVMLRGNRGSTLITYFTREGRLRIAPILDGRGTRPEALEREDLELITRLLDQAFGISRANRRRPHPGPEDTRASSAPRSPAPAAVTTKARARPHRPTTLTPEQLERFITRGYITLRDAFPRELAEAWVRDSIQRIREDPARWVRGYREGDPGRDLRGFDVARPETWTWERMDVEGSLGAPIAELAPRVWGAMCDLLGGPDRIKTRDWTNYFAVNVNDHADVPWRPPPLHSPSWHFDDPQVDTRLDTYRHGLIALAYFTDVAPRSGGTFIAPESFAHAARALADHPEGMDWLERAVGPRLLAQCEEFIELTGPVGTVTLCHPFMLHSSSANPSGKVRFLGNLVVDLKAPLNVAREDRALLSPVERAILRALGRPDA